MANYKYKVEDKEYILSEDEHQKVLDATKKGGGLVILRNGDLMINTNFIRRSNETMEQTIEQREASEKKVIENTKKYTELPDNVSGVAMLLSAGRPVGNNGEKPHFLVKNHFSFYEKMGWNHDKPNCLCKSEG